MDGNLVKSCLVKSEGHSAQIGYVHGARNGNRTGRFHERKRYTRSNLKSITEMSTEYQRPIYMCFIDYSKALDFVDHPTLWNMMEEMGIPEHIVQVIRSLYANQEAKVRTEYGDTESFSIGKGSDKSVFPPRMYSTCTVRYLHHEASKPRGTRHRSENGRKKNKQVEICG